MQNNTNGVMFRDDPQHGETQFPGIYYIDLQYFKFYKNIYGKK